LYGETERAPWNSALGEDFRAVAGGADLGYLRRWTADLGVAYVLEKCLDERHDA